ncbi:MAG TPA: hypothetical protein VGQ77_14330, partial [Methylomirabilota bacterium]|nr:hypothetical protein [Methylomirabilota bacterium]
MLTGAVRPLRTQAPRACRGAAIAQATGVSVTGNKLTGPEALSAMADEFIGIRTVSWPSGWSLRSKPGRPRAV